MSKFLKYNPLTRMWCRIREPVKEGPQSLQVDFMTGHNYRTLFLTGCLGLLSFYANQCVMKARKETFGRNYALIEKKYG